MRRTYSIVLFFILLLIGCAVNCAFAEEGSNAAATVIAIRGDVKAINAEGKERTLIMKSPIYSQDTIKTGKRGRIQIFFTDNSIISLGRNSEMKIAEYKWEADEKTGALKTEVKEGVFRVMGGAITKASPEKFVTETPTATIGIRGSMYAGRVSAGALSVVFQGGKGINVFNDRGSVSISRPGYGTRVRLNNPPNRPYKFRNKDITSFSRELAVNGDKPDGRQIKDGDTKEDGPASDAGAENRGMKEEGARPELNTEDGKTDGGIFSLSSSNTTPPPRYDSSSLSAGLPPPISEEADGVISYLSSLDLPPPPKYSANILSAAPLPAPVGSSGFVPPTNNQIFTTSGTSMPSGSPAPADIPTPLDSDPLVDTTAAPTPPINGISVYKGTLSGMATQTSPAGQGSIDDVFMMQVNWYNKKVLGKIAGQFNNTPKFFLGDVCGTSVTNVQFFGSDQGLNYNINAIEGNGSGSFVGGDASVFNGTALGLTYLMADSAQIQNGTWELSAAGYSDQSSIHPSPKGTTSDPDWKGYVVAVGEDMNNPMNNRQLFMNTNCGDFTLDLDKDSGTIAAGRLSSITGLGQIDSLNIGGSNPSVFISDHSMASALSLNVGTGLKAHDNFMVTAAPEKQSATYAAWGYWEIAYSDVYEYHAHVPATMWVAGEPTTNMPTGFIGTYKGKAFATRIENGQPFKKLEGSLNLNVDFSTRAISGNIDLGEINLVGISASITTSTNYFTGGSFTAGKLPDGSTVPITPTNTINGTFFGPNAKSVAGNFRADLSSTNSYIGIYAGDR